MPIESEKQRRAMWAAKEGRSTLGIPRDVAEKFLAGDETPVKGHAAGCIHVTRDGLVLLLKRGGEEGVDNFVGHWALPGGRANDGESPIEAAHRETAEETGYEGRGPMKLLDQVRTPNNMAFHTFVRPVQKFTPQLNAEHVDHAWANLDDLPQPLHPAVAKTLEGVTSGEDLFDWAWDDGDFAQDSVHAACGGRGCAGCGGSGVSPITYAPMKPSLANDAVLAFDRAPEGMSIERHGIVVTLAFDKSSESVRRTDDFARLHVKSSPITKACVSPYYGREIPKSRELGLEPNRVYRLLRHPDEIKKGAATSHNVPLLSRHVPHTADDHDGEITVGTTGSNSEYVHPYLYNSLAVWSRDGIEHVESGDQKELSSAYSYDADMTPGVYEGEPYDGVMRNMVWNHVALVKKGRAGSDVVVGDEALQPDEETTTMAKKILSLKAGVALGAVRAHLAGVKLAQDAALPDISPLFRGVKAGTLKKESPKIVAGIKTLLKGKLAQDADLAGVVDGVQKLMTSIEGDKTVKDADIGEEVDPAMMEGSDPDADEGAEDGGLEAICAYLKSKGVPDDVLAGMPGMGDAGADSGGGPTDKMAARTKEKAALDKDTIETEDGPDGKEEKFDKGAMDAAIAKAQRDTMATMRGIQEALKHVAPRVGEINMAFDSAPAVYHKAFEMIGNKTAKKISDVEALKGMWDMLPTTNRPREPMAQDSATGGDDFEKRFKNASRVKRLAS